MVRQKKRLKNGSSKTINADAVKEVRTLVCKIELRFDEIEGESMKEEDHNYGLSSDKRYKLRAINRLAIGFIILAWGSLLALKQSGIIEKDVSTLPFAFVAFGALLIFGGVYRLGVREKTVRA